MPCRVLVSETSNPKYISRQLIARQCHCLIKSIHCLCSSLLITVIMMRRTSHGPSYDMMSTCKPLARRYCMCH